MVIPEKNMPKLKKLLIRHYEDKDNGEITAFMKDKCWRKM